jgi:hypothetical protein
MTDRHPRGDSMRIDDQVRNDTLLSEWHIFLPVSHTDSTLLTVTRSKLVTNLWDSDRPHLDLCEPVPFFISGEDYTVDHTALRVLDLGGAVLPWLQHVGSSC